MAAQMNSIKDPFITLSSGALMQCKTVFQLLPWEMFTYQQKIHNTKKKNRSSSTKSNYLFKPSQNTECLHQTPWLPKLACHLWLNYASLYPAGASSSVVMRGLLSSLETPLQPRVFAAALRATYLAQIAALRKEVLVRHNQFDESLCWRSSN